LHLLEMTFGFFFEQLHFFSICSSSRDFGVEQFFRADGFQAVDPSPWFFDEVSDSRPFHKNVYPIDKKKQCLALLTWLRLHFFKKKTLKCSKNWRHFKFSFVLKTDYVIIEQTTWLVFHADRTNFQLRKHSWIVYSS